MKVCDRDSQINYGKVIQDFKKLGGLMEIVVAMLSVLLTSIPILFVLVGFFVLEAPIKDVLLFNNHIGLVEFEHFNSFSLFGVEIWTLNLIMVLSFFVAPWFVYKIVAMYVEDYKNDRESFNYQMKVLMVGTMMVGMAFEFLFYFYPPDPSAALVPKSVMTMITVLLFVIVMKQNLCKRYTIKKK